MRGVVDLQHPIVAVAVAVQVRARDAVLARARRRAGVARLGREECDDRARHGDDVRALAEALPIGRIDAAHLHDGVDGVRLTPDATADVADPCSFTNAASHVGDSAMEVAVRSRSRAAAPGFQRFTAPWAGSSSDRRTRHRDLAGGSDRRDLARRIDVEDLQHGGVGSPVPGAPASMPRTKTSTCRVHVARLVRGGLDERDEAPVARDPGRLPAPRLAAREADREIREAGLPVHQSHRGRSRVRRPEASEEDPSSIRRETARRKKGAHAVDADRIDVAPLDAARSRTMMPVYPPAPCAL